MHRSISATQYGEQSSLPSKNYLHLSNTQSINTSCKRIKSICISSKSINTWLKRSIVCTRESFQRKWSETKSYVPTTCERWWMSIL